MTQRGHGMRVVVSVAAVAVVTGAIFGPGRSRRCSASASSTSSRSSRWPSSAGWSTRCRLGLEHARVQLLLPAAAAHARADGLGELGRAGGLPRDGGRRQRARHARAPAGAGGGGGRHAAQKRCRQDGGSARGEPRPALAADGDRAASEGLESASLDLGESRPRGAARDDPPRGRPARAARRQPARPLAPRSGRRPVRSGSCGRSTSSSPGRSRRSARRPTARHGRWPARRRSSCRRRADRARARQPARERA